MWEGRQIRHIILNWHTAIGGKPPPTWEVQCLSDRNEKRPTFTGRAFFVPRENQD
jgi:hypothetical protein